MLIAIIVCLIIMIILFINAINKVDIELPSKKAELVVKEKKTEKDIFEEYKIEEKAKVYNEENKLKIEVEFSKKLYNEKNESNKEYYEVLIKELVKVHKTDFILVDNKNNIKIEVFATSENNYKYKINNIENYYQVVDEKNELIKDFKEIESIDADIENKELNKFDNNKWSVKSAGVKILEYGEDYLGYNNYKILTNDIYIDTIILESTFEEEVVEGIKVGTSKSDIKEKLGEPTFEDNGYKLNDSYMYFYEDEIAIYPNTKFDNRKVENLLIEYINLEEKEERKVLAYKILQENFDFKSHIDENNVLNLVSVNRGIIIKIDTDNNVTGDLYNNYDFTKQTSDYIRNGIFSLESNIDLINETEKNRK